MDKKAVASGLIVTGFKIMLGILIILFFTGMIYFLWNADWKKMKNCWEEPWSERFDCIKAISSGDESASAGKYRETNKAGSSAKKPTTSLKANYPKQKADGTCNQISFNLGSKTEEYCLKIKIDGEKYNLELLKDNKVLDKGEAKLNEALFFPKSRMTITLIETSGGMANLNIKVNRGFVPLRIFEGRRFVCAKNIMMFKNVVVTDDDVDFSLYAADGKTLFCEVKDCGLKKQAHYIIGRVENPVVECKPPEQISTPPGPQGIKVLCNKEALQVFTLDRCTTS